MDLPGLFLTLPDGPAIAVPSDLRLITPFVVLEQDDWFEPDIRFLRTLDFSGAHAVDVGANFGAYTLALAAAVGPQGRVSAVEPAASTAGWLARTLRANALEQRVDLHRLALSDRSGDGRLAAGSSPELSRLTATAAGGEAVQVCTLDALAGAWRDVAFLKVDAEGHDAAVLRGGGDLLRRESPLVMVECGQGEDPAAILADAGYGRYRLAPGLGLLAEMPWPLPLQAMPLNLHFAKPDRSAFLADAGRLVTADAVAEAAGRLRVGTGDRAGVLALWAVASAEDEAPPMRFAAAASALDAHLQARTEWQDGDRLTAGRLAAALGFDTDAAAFLAPLLPRALAAALTVPAVEFLPTLPRFDGLSPEEGPSQDGDGRAWMQAMVLEAYEAWQHVSSQYTPLDSYRRADALAGNRFAAPVSHRRRALLRLAAGADPEIGPGSPLLVPGPGNRNAAYWQTQVRPRG